MSYELHEGDCLAILPKIPDKSIHCCVTSPPYWNLRDYNTKGQLGLEKTPKEYVTNLIKVFREVRRVLRDDGTLWVNLGDSYAKDSKLAGVKPKNLVGIPWRVAFALQTDGWCLRSEIIWSKPNPMPESVTDRPTKAHEYIFLLVKNRDYYYDADAVREPSITKDTRRPYGVGQVDSRGTGHDRGGGSARTSDSTTRNIRSVWTVTTQPYKGAHFATFPPKLIEPCIKAGCPPNGTVLDPFSGAGTTGVVARRFGRNYTGIELNPDYCKMQRERLDSMVISHRLFE